MQVYKIELDKKHDAPSEKVTHLQVLKYCPRNTYSLFWKGESVECKVLQTHKYLRIRERVLQTHH